MNFNNKRVDAAILAKRHSGRKKNRPRPRRLGKSLTARIAGLVGDTPVKQVGMWICPASSTGVLKTQRVSFTYNGEMQTGAKATCDGLVMVSGATRSLSGYSPGSAYKSQPELRLHIVPPPGKNKLCPTSGACLVRCGSLFFLLIQK